MSTEAPVIETPPPATPSVAPASESLLASIRVIGRPGSTATPAPDKPTTEAAPESSPAEPTPEPEKKPVDSAPDPTPKPKDEPTAGMSEKAAERFRRLEKNTKQAEQERDTAKKELETHKAELEALKKQAEALAATQKQAQKAIEEAKTYREQLRAVSIERDPEFQERYDGQIIKREEQMMAMVINGGGDSGAFVKAINAADEATLEEFRESLAPHQQRAWDAHRIEIDKLATEKKDALKNSGATWQQMEQDRKQRASGEAERIRIENVEAARSAVDSIRKQIADLDAAGAEQFDDVEAWLRQAVTEAPRDELIQHLARGNIAQRVVVAQKGEIDRLAGELSEKDKKIEELTEKLGEQETFIKTVSSRVPRPNIGGNSLPAEDNGSLLSRTRVILPGSR